MKKKQRHENDAGRALMIKTCLMERNLNLKLLVQIIVQRTSGRGEQCLSSLLRSQSSVGSSRGRNIQEESLNVLQEAWRTIEDTFKEACVRELRL